MQLSVTRHQAIGVDRGASLDTADYPLNNRRWLLEEFRVSLFAQQLKTRVPVSARRLADAWAEREKGTS